jgi:hypothetical protein
VDTRVGDNNSGGVFDGDDHDVVGLDDFDYQELLHRVKPHVLSSMGTQRGLSNTDIFVTPRVSKPHDYANHMFMRL